MAKVLYVKANAKLEEESKDILDFEFYCEI